jgi:hypothetical protein
MANDVSFVKTLATIAHNPVNFFSQFQPITAFERKTGIHPLNAITSAATAIFSAVAFKYNKIVSGLSLLATAVILFKSYSSNPEEKQQRKMMSLVNPCIDGLNRAFLEKAKHIIETLTQSSPNGRTLQERITNAAGAYDGKLPEAQRSIPLDAYALAGFQRHNHSETFDRLDAWADIAVGRLQDAANLYLKGMRAVDQDNDYYVEYSFTRNGTTIFPKPTHYAPPLGQKLLARDALKAQQ